MYGGSGSWYYSTLAGLQRAPGSRSWKELVIAPPYSKGMLEQLTWVNASIDTPMGMVRSCWSSSTTPLTTSTATASSALPPSSASTSVLPVGAGGGTSDAQDSFTLYAVLPPNSRATVIVPAVTAAADTAVITEGAAVVWAHNAFVKGAVQGVTSGVASSDGKSVVFTVGSGSYAFVSAAPAPAPAPAAAAVAVGDESGSAV